MSMRDFRKSQLEHKAMLEQSMAASGVSIGHSATDELARMEAHDSAKKIAGHAVLGGIIAGPAGAVVGGIIGKTKADATKKKY